jgi:hypothetical protein
MSPAEKIRKALTEHLKLLTPTFPTQIENSAFVPTANVPFQRVAMLYANPDNQTLGCNFYKELGIMQIDLCYPTGKLNSDCQSKADEVRAHFQRGTLLSYDGQNVRVMTTPSKFTLGIRDDRYVVAVSISYSADVFG